MKTKEILKLLPSINSVFVYVQFTLDERIAVRMPVIQLEKHLLTQFKLEDEIICSHLVDTLFIG